MSKDAGLIKFALVLTVFGGTWLFKGYRKFKVRRIAEDLPTSPIRTASQGLVEFQGIANALAAPQWIGMSGKPVVYSEIEGQYLAGSKNKDWVTAFTCTLGDRFIIQDKTGAAHVLTKGADFEIESVTTPWESLSIDAILSIQNHIYPISKKKGLLFDTEPGNGTWRIIDKTIHPGQEVYIVGTFKTRSLEKPIKILGEKGSLAEVQPCGGIMKSANHPFIIASCKQEELLKRTDYGFIQMIAAAAVLAGAVFCALMEFNSR